MVSDHRKERAIKSSCVILGVFAMAATTMPAQATCQVPPGAVQLRLPSGLPPALRDALPGNIALPGEPFDTQGMKIGFHNHTVEMEMFDGKTGFEWFAESAPDVILTVDLAWAAQGGQDPTALLKRLKGHVWNVHVKDTAPMGMNKDQRGLANLGEGVLKWDQILPAAREAGVQWYTLEHDVPKPDALTVLKSANAYLTPRLQKVLGL